MPQQDENSDVVGFGEDHKHLVFRLGDELFGTPLIAIREISKMRPIKPVPYMVSYFRGIVNLRGQIVSIVDLRIKLETLHSDKDGGLLIIVDLPVGTIGAIVDDVVAVWEFPPDSLTNDLAMETKVPTAFFKGVAHHGDHLVNVIDIAGTITSDDLNLVMKSQSA